MCVCMHGCLHACKRCQILTALTLTWIPTPTRTLTAPNGRACVHMSAWVYVKSTAKLHTRTYGHIYTYVHIHAPIHARTHTRMHPHADAHTHIHTYTTQSIPDLTRKSIRWASRHFYWRVTFSHPGAWGLRQRPTHTHTHIQTQMYVYMLAYKSQHIHIHTHARIHKHLHTYTYMHTLIQIHKQTPTHSPTPTHILICTHTHYLVGAAASSYSRSPRLTLKSIRREPRRF